MKRGLLFLLIFIGIEEIRFAVHQDQSFVSNSLLSSQVCVLHECQQDDVQDLTWFEWIERVFESCFLWMKITVCNMRIYLFSEMAYESISLLQQKLAENAAELGYVKKALWYSRKSLENSVLYLAEFESKFCKLQKSVHVQSALIQTMSDTIMKYTQHVQAHIITMTDFASDEKQSVCWELYEKMLMRYFEKLQQVMQTIDECDEFLCQRDSKYCASESQQAALLAVTEECMSSDFDPDMYD